MSRYAVIGPVVERDWRWSAISRIGKPACALFPAFHRRRIRCGVLHLDIHGLFKPRKDIREVMFQGGVSTRFMLLRRLHPRRNLCCCRSSDPDRRSWVVVGPDASKPGMQRNILDREQALKDNGPSYIICRAAN